MQRRHLSSMWTHESRLGKLFWSIQGPLFVVAFCTAFFYYYRHPGVAPGAVFGPALAITLIPALMWPMRCFHRLWRLSEGGILSGQAAKNYVYKKFTENRGFTQLVVRGPFAIVMDERGKRHIFPRRLFHNDREALIRLEGDQLYWGDKSALARPKGKSRTGRRGLRRMRQKQTHRRRSA